MEITFVKHLRKSREIFGMSKTGGVRIAGERFHPRERLREFPAGWILAGLLAFLLIFPLSASATSPSDVQLAYTEKEQTLQVTIIHNSFLPNSHYIKQVEIQKNSEKPIVYEYKSQPDKVTFTYTYKLPLKESDRVEVKAICNLYGSRSASLIVAGTGTK